MVWLTKIHFVTLILVFSTGRQVESDASSQSYNIGDVVPFYANKFASFGNPRETYAYYDLPFCSPDTVEKKIPNLGEMLNGDSLVSTPFKLEFRVDKHSEKLCTKTLNRADVSRFRSAIDKDYYVEYYYDNLPVWAHIGGYSDGNTRRYYSLFSHFDFNILYNDNHIIAMNITVHSKFPYSVTIGEVYKFTYNVKWSETSKSFEDRMDVYMSPDHHSFTNSSLTLLVLIVCLLTLYMKVIRNDISMYERNLQDVEENQVADNQEDTGWKNIHGDVFRFPQHKSLFSAALGSGTHLLVLIISLLVLGLLEFFPPFARGVFWNALVVIYAVTSLVSGYTSVSFYSQLEGTNSMKIILLTGGLLFVPLFLTFGFLNSVAIFYGTTVALPLRGIVILTGLWVFLASPLLLLGGFIGKNRSSDFQTPCKTAKCPKEVPQLRWYRGVIPQMALAGILPFSVLYVQLYYIFETVWGHRVYTFYNILSVVFFLLLIMTALVSVVLTYFQLAAEDHEWWWRSFFCGGSTGVFIYGYCIYYYFWISHMSGLMQTSFFFGYMACVSYGMFLALGSVGFRASLLFVRYLYTSIKSE